MKWLHKQEITSVRKINYLGISLIFSNDRILEILILLLKNSNKENTFKIHVELQDFK